MDVRQVRPTDTPLVLSVALCEDLHLVKGRAWPESSPIGHTILRSMLPLSVPGKSWIARNGGTVGLLEACPRRYVIGWDITRLAARGAEEEAVSSLIAAATSHLQSRGVPRLFARCGEKGREALRRLDFHTLAREYVLLSPPGPIDTDAPLPINSRYCMPSDAWPLHQLELVSTPPLVRQFEGLTSMDWARPPRAMSEIVVERDSRIVAWIGWGTKVRPGLLYVSMLVHPRYKDLGPALLSQALRNLPTNSRFVARVREYHVETLNVFLEAGFAIASEETVMMKHAGMEPAREVKGILRVAGVPGIQALPVRLGSPQPRSSHSVAHIRLP